MAETDHNNLYENFNDEQQSGFGSSSFDSSDHNQTAFVKPKINFNVRNQGVSTPDAYGQDNGANAQRPHVRTVPPQQAPNMQTQSMQRPPQGAAQGMQQRPPMQQFPNMQTQSMQRPPQGAAQGMQQRPPMQQSPNMQTQSMQRPPQGAAQGMQQRPPMQQSPNMQTQSMQRPPQGAAQGMQQRPPMQQTTQPERPVMQQTTPRPQPTERTVEKPTAQPKPDVGIVNETAAEKAQRESAYNRMLADIAAMNRNMKAADSKMVNGFDAVKSRVDNSWQDLGKKLDNSTKVTADRFDRQQAVEQKSKQEILCAVNASTDQIMEQIATNAKRGDAELNRLTPSQHYRNMKLSILALVFSVFSALMLSFSFLSFINGSVTNTVSAVILLDFCFVYLIAAGGLTFSFIQKAAFFAKGSFKEYIKSKNPAHSLSRAAMFTSVITAFVNTVVMIVAMIVVL